MPIALPVMVDPLIVHMFAGATLKVTGSFEDAVAVISPVLPTVMLGAIPKLRDCAPLPTEIDCVFCAGL